MLFKTCFLSSLIATALVAGEPSTLPNTEGKDLLTQMSETFTKVAEKAMPATVFIRTKMTPSQPQVNPFEFFQDDLFRRFFGFPQQPMQEAPQQAAGSGFLIRSDGLIVTNNHLIQEATEISVTLNDGREYTATVKGSDPRTDLALLQIDEKDLPYLTFGDSDRLRIAEWVVAIGNPFGFEATLTAGVISAKGRQDIGLVPYEDFLQTDAAINPGNSGGPLLNLNGEVVGVNTAIFTRSGGSLGIGLSIPSRMAQGVIEQIIASGSVKRAYLGVVLQPLDKALAEAAGVAKQGIVISDVVKGSPADQGGLKQGDILLEYNGAPIKTLNKFRNDIAMMQPGSPASLKVLRGNEPVQLTITLGSQGESEMATGELLQKMGFEHENLTPEWSMKLGLPPEVSGVVITQVKPGSPAFEAGLRPGFLITGIALDWNHPQPVHSRKELEEALQNLGERKTVILIARQQNFQRYHTVKLK